MHLVFRDLFRNIHPQSSYKDSRTFWKWPEYEKQSGGINKVQKRITTINIGFSLSKKDPTYNASFDILKDIKNNKNKILNDAIEGLFLIKRKKKSHATYAILEKVD